MGGRGSTHLGQISGDPMERNIKNTTLFLKTGKNKDRLLMMGSEPYHGKSHWMTPGGEIDGPGNKKANYADPSYEAALVREFLEETGLKEFPKLTNACYYDYGKPYPHTRVFVAETDDDLQDFRPQIGECLTHHFQMIKYMLSSKQPTIKGDKIRFHGSLAILAKPDQIRSFHMDDLAKFRSKTGRSCNLGSFEGARLWTDGKGNEVVKKGKAPQQGWVLRPRPLRPSAQTAQNTVANSAQQSHGHQYYNSQGHQYYDNSQVSQNNHQQSGYPNYGRASQGSQHIARLAAASAPASPTKLYCYSFTKPLEEKALGWLQHWKCGLHSQWTH